jgi:hypothetical protein
MPANSRWDLIQRLKGLAQRLKKEKSCTSTPPLCLYDML